MHDRLAHRDGEVMVEMDEFLADLVASLRGSTLGAVSKAKT